MAKIPFTVSARTARLIGRENIASSKGAIIELVKNSYDADSQICIVYFDTIWSSIRDTLSEAEFAHLLERGIDEDLLGTVYFLNGGEYLINNDVADESLEKLSYQLKELESLYIIDAGEGMVEEVITNHWMTIGTDHKLLNVFTKSGRVRSGAKGIGRFALDKLGTTCEMVTKFNPEAYPSASEEGIQGYRWKVNWDDFEGNFKRIESVTAELDELNELDFNSFLKKELHYPEIIKVLDLYKIKHGTVLKIQGLRDNWDDFFINQVFTDLEVLVPPRESSDFDLYVVSSHELDKYGMVLTSICDDYDYKLVAKANDNQNVEIRIFRNEYEIEKINPVFFDRESMQEFPYRKKDFIKGFWDSQKSFSQLLPGFNDVDEDNTFEGVGAFEFTFYFMKKTFSTPDADRFYYKQFMSGARKKWFDEFGGIKLFRDNFRVRPYGEVKDASFDWLQLGARKSGSPAGAAKKGGGYRINPDNIAGAIKISRLTNVNFEDKASREGLQDSKVFQILKKMLIGIIAQFENDRAYIFRELNTYYDEINKEAQDRQFAEQLAKDILKERRKKKARERANNEDGRPDTNDSASDPEEDPQLEILAQLSEEKDEEIEALKDEQKILRGLASTGIIVASFTHELSNLNDVLSSRVDELIDMTENLLPQVQLLNIPDYLNPYVMMEDMKKQDVKLRNWLSFSIGSARKDKRRRKNLDIVNYFIEFKKTWFVVLENRGVELVIPSSEDLIKMRVFEVDLDSIFNNLLINSIDAFVRSKKKTPKIITITLKVEPSKIVIIYKDSGPGLSSDIADPYDIFKPMYTTKLNRHTGEEEGTGIGMWLVDHVIKDNSGKHALLFGGKGFGLKISFPYKYQRGMKSV